MDLWRPYLNVKMVQIRRFWFYHQKSGGKISGFREPGPVYFAGMEQGTRKYIRYRPGEYDK